MKTRTALTRRLAGGLTITALAVGSTLAVGALSPAAAVSPIPTGSLTGTVVGASGAIPNAYVYIYGDTDLDGDYDDVNSSGSTGLAGDYIFNHLRPGNYKIEYYAGGYDSEYYNDADDMSLATAVVVGTGNSVVPAVTLATAAPSVVVDADTDLTGLVTDAANGRALYGVHVDAIDTTTGYFIGSTHTDSVGRYEFDNLDGHATVKLSFEDENYGGANLGYRAAWSGGARTKATAAPVTLTPGTAVTASQGLTRLAGISGRAVNPAGAAPLDGYVRVYDVDSDLVSATYLRPDGTFYAGDLNPGEQYKVQFSDAYDYPGNDTDADPTYYFDVWYASDSDFTTATAVAAGAGGSFVPNVDVTLRDSLVALEQPSITGSFVVGKTLTGNKGRWNRNGNSTFSYEWLRGGATVIGTASTYTLTAADAGQSISLRVTNTNFDYGVQKTLSATTAAGVAKFTSAVSAKAKKVKKGKKAGAALVTISVKVAGQAASKITGTVKVTEGKKKVATVKVKKGKATFLVTKAGKHSYKLAYSGNGSTLSDTGKVTVTVKKSKK